VAQPVASPVPVPGKSPVSPVPPGRPHRWPVVAVRRTGRGDIDGLAMLFWHRRCATAVVADPPPNRSSGPPMRSLQRLFARQAPPQEADSGSHPRPRPPGSVFQTQRRCGLRRCRVAGLGAAELRGCGAAELRGCGAAELRGCGAAELRGCGAAGSRRCGVGGVAGLRPCAASCRERDWGPRCGAAERRG
jgi:hypothetical protein